MFSDFLINCPACTCLCSMSSQPTVQRVQVYVRCLLNQLSSVHVTMFDVVSINYPTYRPTSCFVFDLTDRSQQFSVYVSCCGQSYLIRSQLFKVHVSFSVQSDFAANCAQCTWSFCVQSDFMKCTKCTCLSVFSLTSQSNAQSADFAANCTQCTCLSVFGLTLQLTVHSARVFCARSDFAANCTQCTCLLCSV